MWPSYEQGSTRICLGFALTDADAPFQAQYAPQAIERTESIVDKIRRIFQSFIIVFSFTMFFFCVFLYQNNNKQAMDTSDTKALNLSLVKGIRKKGLLRGFNAHITNLDDASMAHRDNMQDTFVEESRNKVFFAVLSKFLPSAYPDLALPFFEKIYWDRHVHKDLARKLDTIKLLSQTWFEDNLWVFYIGTVTLKSFFELKLSSEHLRPAGNLKLWGLTQVTRPEDNEELKEFTDGLRKKLVDIFYSECFGSLLSYVKPSDDDKKTFIKELKEAVNETKKKRKKPDGQGEAHMTKEQKLQLINSSLILKNTDFFETLVYQGPCYFVIPTTEGRDKFYDMKGEEVKVKDQMIEEKNLFAPGRNVLWIVYDCLWRIWQPELSPAHMEVINKKLELNQDVRSVDVVD
jgi:cbb3-type cytochrome oxidase subunit 3